MSATWVISQARSLLDHRVLDDLVAAPLESPLPERRAQRRQIAALFARFGRGGVGGRARWSRESLGWPGEPWQSMH